MGCLHLWGFEIELRFSITPNSAGIYYLHLSKKVYLSMYVLEGLINYYFFMAQHYT